MAVSKRTRFEVLRRDDYTCRYCRSQDNELCVDHVLPVALGGRDDPDNLVACCKNCNQGKASIPPDAPLVADVAADALRWSRAIATVAKRRAKRTRERGEYVTAFIDEWTAHNHDFRVPTDWEASLWTFHRMSLPLDEMREAVYIAASRLHVPDSERWRYFVGTCWRKLDDIHGDAAALLRGE